MPRLLLRERHVVSENSFAETVIWQLPRAVPGSSHRFKYRLAFVVDEVCVLRFDNETGKGDHKHLREREVAYRFVSLEQLLADFWEEVALWSATQAP
jgi:hypothetical protein